jgi:hypothetical protein
MLIHPPCFLAILVDAEAAGKLVDDRNYPGGYAELAELLTPHVAKLQALYADVKAPLDSGGSLVDFYPERNKKAAAEMTK